MHKNKDFMLRKIAGQNVLVATGKSALEYNGLLSMSETGAFIWENLENANSFEDMVSLMLSEFEVDEITVRNDLKGFSNEMLKREFIFLDDEAKEW